MASSARQFARVATRTTTRSFVAAPRQAFRQQGRRFYSSEAEKKPNPVVYLGLAAATAGLGIWYFTSGASASPSSFVPTQAHYQQVYNDIASRLEVEDYDDGSYGPVLVRLAWHASGTYDKETKTGGSNGATMRFAPESGHGANAGLIAARDFCEPIKGESLLYSMLVPYPTLTTYCSQVPLDQLLRSLDPCRCLRHPGDVGTRRPFPTRPSR